MNILFLSTRSPYPLISGHSLRTYHILKGAAREHDVTLVTFAQHPEHELKPENLDHLRSFCKAVHPFHIPADMSRATLFLSLLRNLFSGLPFVARKYDAPEMRKKIREILAHERIDLVHVDLLPLAVYLDEFPNLPRILVNHNVESVRLRRWFETERNPLKKLFLGYQWLKLRAFERDAMNRFNCCVTVSETDRELLRGMGVAKPMVVVPNGTDTSSFKPSGKPVTPNTVLWFGHMDVHTNRDAVLYFWNDIYPVLRERRPDVSVSFVGTSPPGQIAEAARCNPLLKATGFVDDIRPYVDEAAVVIVPIRIGSGTRLKILDAMAMGKVIVSTSVGCEGLAVTDGENIAIADTPLEFVDRIETLLGDEQARRSMAENARKLAETYDWSIINELQKDAYRLALESAGEQTGTR
jgi:glycosyltransferase involved in cell wall biosynthesis